jgi:dCMP deaminase
VSWTESDNSILLRCLDKAEGIGTCLRRNVWAILFRTDGSEAWEAINQPADAKSYCSQGLCPRGRLGFDEIPQGAPYEGEHPCTYIHAGEVAITAAGLVNAYNGIMYCSEPPCWQCTKLMVYVHINTIHLPDGVVIDSQCNQLLNQAGVTVVYHAISGSATEESTGRDHGEATHHDHELGSDAPQ